VSFPKIKDKEFLIDSITDKKNAEQMNEYITYHITELSKDPRIQFWFAVAFDSLSRISEKMRFLIKPTIFLLRAIHCFVNGLLLEPYDTPWTQFISVSPSLTSGEAYIENYAFTSDCLPAIHLQKSDFKPCKCFVYAKRGDGKIMCRRMELPIFVHPKTSKIYYDGETSNIETTELRALYKRPILSVVYKDPDDQANTIVFDIDKDIYQVGNEILSKEFVARYLRYHSSSVAGFAGYTDKYRLEVMDKDMKFMEIGSDELIVLKDDDYEVIRI